MSFRDYVAMRQARDNPQGDFVRDARADPTFPDAGSWQELRSYLEIRGAIDPAIDAGRLVWAGYMQKRRKMGV